MNSELYSAIAPPSPFPPAYNPEASPELGSTPSAAVAVQDEVSKLALGFLKAMNFFDVKALAEQQKRMIVVLDGGLTVVLNLLNLGTSKPEYCERLKIALEIAPKKYTAHLILEWIKEQLILEGDNKSSAEAVCKAREVFFAADLTRLEGKARADGLIVRGYLEYCAGKKEDAFLSFFRAFHGNNNSKCIAELAEAVLQQLDPETYFEKFTDAGIQSIIDLHSWTDCPGKEVYLDWQIKILEKYLNNPTRGMRSHFTEWYELFRRIFSSFGVTESRKQKLGDLYYDTWLFAKNKNKTHYQWPNGFKLQVLKEAAETCGNIKALHELGYAMFHGCDFMFKGVNPFRDPTYLLKAANQGYAPSQYALGMIAKKEYKGAPRLNIPTIHADLAEAMKWFQKVIDAEPSHANAHWELGCCYLGKQDQLKGMSLIAKAAKLGCAKAQKEVAANQKYYDLVKLAEEGDSEAQCELGKMFDPLDKADSIFVKSEEEAFRWYEKAIAQDFTEAIAKMVLRYKDNVRLLLKDLKRDFALLQKLASKGGRQGLFELARSFWNGTGTERDYVKAIELYKQAAEKGHTIATPECQKYHDHFEEILAALKGNGELQYKVSQWFDPDCDKFRVFKADKSAAIYWLEMAAENGSVDAISTLYRYYTNGVGVSADSVKAGQYFNKLVHLQSAATISSSKKPKVKKKES